MVFGDNLTFSYRHCSARTPKDRQIKGKLSSHIMHQRSWVYRSLWNPSNNAPVIALNYFSGFVLDRFNCMVTVDAYSTGASVLVASGLLLAQRERAAHDIQMMNRLLKTPVASALILHPPGYRVAALWVSGINIAEHVCISYAGNRTAHGV